MAVSAHWLAGLNHLCHSSLGSAVEALKGPGVEGSSVRWCATSRVRQGAQKVQGSVAHAATNFDAEREENVVLGRCGWKPILPLLSCSFIVCVAWGLGAFFAVCGDGGVIGAAVCDNGSAIWVVWVEDYIGAFVGVDHVGTGFIARRCVGRSPNAVEHSGKGIMPVSRTETSEGSGASNSVVTKHVDIWGGEGNFVPLESLVGVGFAKGAAARLTRCWGYLK